MENEISYIICIVLLVATVIALLFYIFLFDFCKDKKNKDKKNNLKVGDILIFKYDLKNPFRDNEWNYDLVTDVRMNDDGEVYFTSTKCNKDGDIAPKDYVRYRYENTRGETFNPEIYDIVNHIEPKKEEVIDLE